MFKNHFQLSIILFLNCSQIQTQLNMNAIKTNIRETHKLLLRKLEEQAQKLAKNELALERSHYELEQFAYVASHDLKSPLRNISSYAQLLQKRYHGQLDSDADEFINYIVLYTQKMNDILTELLDYSRVDRNKTFKLTPLSKILDLAILNMRNTLEQNNVTIHSGDLPELIIQKDAFQPLFEHLIENAIVFKSDLSPVVHISAKRLDLRGTWQITVRDNGVGLDATYHEKAFLPFQRINNRERPGCGMGLAICRKVVKMHGGDIWYERNTDSKGTSFHFTISQMFIEKTYMI
jgi:chemotaxis family two-component system sensor kinase Cph1